MEQTPFPWQIAVIFLHNLCLDKRVLGTRSNDLILQGSATKASAVKTASLEREIVFEKRNHLDLFPPAGLTLLGIYLYTYCCTANLAFVPFPCLCVAEQASPHLSKSNPTTRILNRHKAGEGLSAGARHSPFSHPPDSWHSVATKHPTPVCVLENLYLLGWEWP